MFVFTRIRAVLLALAQVWLIVMGTLACGIHGKMARDSGFPLPLPTMILLHAGFVLLWVPLIWICAASLIRLRPEVPDVAKEAVYQVGWLLLIALVIYIAMAFFSPFLSMCQLAGYDSESE